MPPRPACAHGSSGNGLAVLAGLVAFAMLASCGGKPATRAVVVAHVEDVNANDILFRAIGLVGTPYRYGGNTPQGGFDCSGLVGFVYDDVAGVRLPRSAEAMSRLEGDDIQRSRLAPGDLVFFRERRDKVGHVGIYVGEGRFVHAPNTGGTVRLDALDGDYWRRHYDGAKRLFR